MITCKTKKWGNSLGILIPKKEASRLNLKPDKEITIQITEKENPLKELFGFGKNKKISKKEIRETRKLMESKWK